MEILGIGIPELFFIVLLILILLGPKDMQKSGRAIGQWLNRLVRSDFFRILTRTGEEIREMPTKLMREANLEETLKEVGNIGGAINKPVAETQKAIARSFDEKQTYAPNALETPSASSAEPPQSKQNGE
jgi:Sec-independent protein translocase protein TatA